MERGGEAAAEGKAAEGREEEEDGGDDFGYRLFPDRNKKPQSFLARSLFTFHNRCQLMLRMTLDTSKRFPPTPGPAPLRCPGWIPGCLCGGGGGPCPPPVRPAAVTLGRGVSGREGAGLWVRRGKWRISRAAVGFFFLSCQKALLWLVSLENLRGLVPFWLAWALLAT